MGDRLRTALLGLASSATAAAGIVLAAGAAGIPVAQFERLAVFGAGVLIAALGLGAFAHSILVAPRLRQQREALRLLRAVLDNLQSGAVILRRTADGEFIVADANAAVERIDGVRRDAINGERVAKVLPWLRAAGLNDVLDRVSRTGQPEQHAPFNYVQNGDDNWRETYVCRLADGVVVAIYSDITSRIRNEDALKESEARWRSIIEMQTVAIVLVDHKYEIRFVNKAAEALFGQAAHELIGVPFGFPVVRHDAAEIEIIRPGRGIAYAEMRAVSMRWGGEEQFLLFIQDVSAFKRAEGDLRKLFQAIEQSPASVVITDIQGRIEYVNPKFTETTGYTYPEVVGKNPRILKSGYTPNDEYDKLWRTISAGEVWHGELYNKKKNGQLFWELASIAPVRNPAGEITHYVAVKEDITERKATEDRLRLSQRMEVIGQLTGGVAHDFNNLLAIIMGNLQLLEEKFARDKEARDLIADALWSAERGAQLTHGLLAFARRQRLNPKLIDVNNIVREMTELLRRTLGERIEIRETLAPDLWTTLVDPGQLESALLNLVVNARDAMAAGGVLTITTANVTLPCEGGPKADEATAGDYVMLSVADTGVGIPAEVQERIFEPFFTTKKVGEGSGLGLSMVYGFVRQSGGAITVASTVGVGTTLSLYLRRADAEEVRPVEGQRRRRRRSGGEVILVVEDDPRVRKTASTVLRERGYRVVEAGDGREALEQLDDIPRLDLLFTDVVLPNGIDGTELARQVLERRPDTRVLFTSGFAAEGDVAAQLKGRAVALLAKPYKQADLTQRVREVLDHRSDSRK